MPCSTVLAFSDPHALQACIRASDVDMVLAGRGDFRAELQQVDLNILWMQRSHTTLPLIARSAMHRSRIAVFFPSTAGQAPIAFSGTDLDMCSATVVAPGAEHYVRLPPDAGWSAMSLAPDKFADTALTLLGHDLSLPRATRHVALPRARMARLRRLHGRAARLAATDPGALTHPEVVRSIEHALAQVLVECVDVGEANRAAPCDGRTSLSTMRRFREVIEANPAVPLQVPDLCRALGVSSRSLARYCMEHLGMPAHRYLWLRRMQMAHRALRRADPVTASVTGLAHDHGFCELGRFAVAYRGLFGESPSATLRRPADA